MSCTPTRWRFCEPTRGLWERGDILLCIRELDVIAVVAIADARVRWWWGAGELSGPHQPSMLPDGRILVFDNGRGVGLTRLLTVDPGTGGGAHRSLACGTAAER